MPGIKPGMTKVSISMFRKAITAVILVPLGIVCIVFAVANRQTVVVSFDPFDSAHPAFAASMPLFILIFVLLILGVLIGGTAVWIRQGRWRHTARRLDGDIRDLRTEMDRLKRQLGEEPPRLGPPPQPDPRDPLRAPVE
jgi:uncharacterized integral membrane protein